MTIQEPPKRTNRSWLWKQFIFIIKILIICAALVSSIRAFLIEPFVVNGSSMNPSFQDREYLLVEKIHYDFHKPARGEVVIFRPPRNEKRYFIKRIIGLPGETVEINDQNVIIYPPSDSQDDTEPIILDESYITHHVSTGRSYTLGEDEYFVMGDNRPHSNDSRSWGAIHKDDIVGRAFLRIRPWSHRAFYPGKYTYTYETSEEVK